SSLYRGAHAASFRSRCGASDQVTTFLHDLRFSVRSLLKAPGFTAIAVLTLMIGIGGTTAIFSVVNGVLLRPLPYPEPDEVMQIRHVGETGGSQISVSYPNFVDLRDQNGTFESMAAYAARIAVLSESDAAVRVSAAEVTGGFFSVLGVTPIL